MSFRVRAKNHSGQGEVEVWLMEGKVQSLHKDVMLRVTLYVRAIAEVNVLFLRFLRFNV